MGPKNWSTLSEEVLHKGFAAWSFLQSYCSERMVEKGINLSQGQLSKLAVEQRFLQQVDSDGNPLYLGFCLGNATFAALFWPVLLFEDDSGFRGYYLDPNGEAHWMYLTNPVEWRVLLPKAVAFNNQIFMVPDPVQTEPLLKFYLRDKSLHKNLLVADLKYLGAFLGLSGFGDDDKRVRKDLMHAIIDFVGKDDNEYITKVKAAMELPDIPKTVGGALDEFVLSELPGEDQSDFKEIAKEVDCKKKVGWSIVEQKWKEATKKKKKNAKPKSRASARRRAQPKVKAKAKARRVPRKLLQKLASDAASHPPGQAPENGAAIEVSGEEAMGGAVFEAEAAPHEAEPVDEAVEANDEAMGGDDAPPPLPPPADIPDDTPLADLVRPVAPAPRPDAPAPARAAAAVHSRGYINQWANVVCATCGNVAGQIKWDPGPGQRDDPTWFMRVRCADGKWGSKYPEFRRRTTGVVGDSDEFPKGWVQENKNCCRG